MPGTRMPDIQGDVQRFGDPSKDSLAAIFANGFQQIVYRFGDVKIVHWICHDSSSLSKRGAVPFCVRLMPRISGVLASMQVLFCSVTSVR